MLVKELIEKLKQMPQDKTVCVYGDCGCGAYGGENDVDVYISNYGNSDDGKVIIYGCE